MIYPWCYEFFKVGTFSGSPGRMVEMLNSKGEICKQLASDETSDLPFRRIDLILECTQSNQNKQRKENLMVDCKGVKSILDVAKLLGLNQIMIKSVCFVLQNLHLNYEDKYVEGFSTSISQERLKFCESFNFQKGKLAVIGSC